MTATLEFSTLPHLAPVFAENRRLRVALFALALASDAAVVADNDETLTDPDLQSDAIDIINTSELMFAIFPRPVTPDCSRLMEENGEGRDKASMQWAWVAAHHAAVIFRKLAHDEGKAWTPTTRQLAGLTVALECAAGGLRSNLARIPKLGQYRRELARMVDGVA